MRIMHTADWHLGRTLEGRSRQEEQEAFVDELVTIADSEQVDLVLMAGDAYDSVNPPAAAEKLYYDALCRLSDGGRRQVAVIAGNHDSPERLAASAPLAERQRIALTGLPRDAVMRFDIARTGERAVLFALPYPSESRLAEVLSDENDESRLRSAYSARVGQLAARQARHFSLQTVNLLMSHLYVLGGAECDSERPIQVGGAYTVDPAALCAGAHYTALGHLHRPQTIKAAETIRYSGSPLAYSFSEAGQAKSVTIVDAKPGGPATWTELFLTSGRPLVKWKAAGGLDEVYRWLDEGKDARAWIDLELRLTASLSMEQIQRLRRLHGGIVQIRPVYPEQEAQQLTVSRQLPVDELFRAFYARQTGGAEPEAELVQLFLELLRESDETGRQLAVESEEPA